jgi:DNA primase
VSPRGKTSAVGPDVPLQISNPDKVFWPDEGYTKLDLIRFYVEVFEPRAICR